MEIVGRNIKQQRKKLGITLRELGERINVSAAFLSQVENGKTSPSLSITKKIAEMINTTVGELIGEEQVGSPNHLLIKENERRLLDHIGNGLKLQFLSTLDRKHYMEPIIHILTPNAVSGTPPYKHEGQEFILVLKGEIKLTISNDDFIMKKGDSIYFESDNDHTFVNIGITDAEVLCVSAPPFF